MKRISLVFAFVCALILSLGMNANAQSGQLLLDQVVPLYNGDTIASQTTTVNFILRVNNNIGKKADVSNGWRIYSPDGAVWTNTKLDSLPPFTAGEWAFALYFNSAWSVWQETAPGGPSDDTVGYIGAGNPTAATRQLPIGYNNTPLQITVTMSGDVANDGKHLCIDSSFWGVGGTWVWTTDLGSQSYTPEWLYAGHTHTPGVGFCFPIKFVPNQPPVITNEPPQVGPQKYCTTFTFDFNATDAEGDPYTFELVSGPGTIDANTGVWVWNTATIADAGAPIAVVVRAKDAAVGPASDPVAILVTNAAPEITTACPGDGGFLSTGSVRTFQLAGTDDCGSMAWSVLDDGNPATTVSIDGTGLLSFSSTEAGTFCQDVVLSDGVLSDQCQVCFTVSAKSGYGVVIEKTHATIQGGFEYVDVTLDYVNPNYGIGGFNILIAYDNSALSLQEVLKGEIYTECGWEYFNYTFGPDGNCNGACPSGMVRVVGIAETNNGANHPICLTPTVPATLFTLKFLVSNDRTLECQYAPIRFFWFECGDNTISSESGNELMIANRVYDYHNIDANVPMDPASAVFPGYAGVPIGACLNPNPDKPAPIRDIDFYDGGVDIVCADSIDARGDINLNNVANEIADAVLFSRYFVYGLGVFTINQAGQIAASDVNADGLVLTVADLVYLVRVITGQALPYYKVSPVAANYAHASNGDLTVQGEMGAAHIVVAGNVTPTLNADGMAMAYNFDGTNTRIIVYPALTEGMTEMASFTGNFINVNGEIVSLEMATVDGAPVAGKLIPSAFALNQNYPNPFNPATTISFALPQASNYTLTIYNVTGQKVAEYTGASEAGMVEVEWNASNNASGIYFYKLNAGNYSATKKMVLLK